MLLFLKLLSLNHVLSNSLTLSPFLILKCIPKIVCVCFCVHVCVHLCVCIWLGFLLCMNFSCLYFSPLWNSGICEIQYILRQYWFYWFLIRYLCFCLCLCFSFSGCVFLYPSSFCVAFCVCVHLYIYVLMLVQYKTFEMYGLISRIMYNVCLWRSNYLGFRILLSKQGKYNHRYVVGKDLWPRLLRAQGTRLPFQHYWVNTWSPGNIHLDA